MATTSRLEWDKDWEVKVANAAANDRKVRADCMARANGITKTAKANLRAANTGSKKWQRRSLMFTLRTVRAKSVKEFPRKRTNPVNSKIPVALAVSDSDWSQRYEYGWGIKIRPSFYMAKAARAYRKGATWYPGGGR